MINIKIKKWDTLFPYFISFIFITLSIILISRHELWFDEVRSWAIGASSSSFKDLIYYMQGSEGHPYTWSAILFLVYKFITQDVEVIKIIHLIISFSAVFIFLKYAAFNKVIKTMFVFNYLIFYEYSIISRNYSMGILLIIIFCIFYKNKINNIYLLAITLFFMSQTSIYSFMISLAFSLLLLCEYITYLKKYFSKKFLHRIFLFIFIIFASIFLLILQFYTQAFKSNIYSPTIGQVFSLSGQDIIYNISFAFKQIVSAMLPINEFKIHFWGNNLIINNLSSDKLLISISLFLIFIPSLLIKRRKIFFYFAGILLILCIPIFIYRGQIRHFGHIFIFIIAFMWLSFYESDGKYLLKNQKFINYFSNIFLIIILSFGLCGSLSAFYFDCRYPFSVQKNISIYIKQNFNLNKTMLSGYKDIDSTAVSAYLNKEIYYPQSNEYNYVSSGHKRIEDLDADEVFLRTLSHGFYNEQILLILNNKLITDPDISSRYFFKKINKDFGDSIVGYEDAGLYIFKKDDIKLARINDAGTFPDAELHSCTISEDKTKIAFDSDKEGLKLFRFPLEVEEYTNYLIEFDLTVDNNITDNILVDLYGEDYDDPFQEFSIKAEEIRIGEKIKISKILNSLAIPDKEIFFRIFTYSPLKAKIENLNIYKLVSSE